MYLLINDLLIGDIVVVVLDISCDLLSSIRGLPSSSVQTSFLSCPIRSDNSTTSSCTASS